MKKYFKFYNINKVISIKPTDLVFNHKVRKACIENKCAQFEKNFMCPPHIGSLEKNKKVVSKFDKGLLIYFSDKIDNTDNREQYYASADILNEIVLASEKVALDVGYIDAKAFIAGHCRRCEPCGKDVGLLRCIEPDIARPSMEAIGIDVIKTCELQGQPIDFNKGEVTWVAMLLIKKE